MSMNDAGLERGQTTTLLPAPGVLGVGLAERLSARISVGSSGTQI